MRPYLFPFRGHLNSRFNLELSQIHHFWKIYENQITQAKSKVSDPDFSVYRNLSWESAIMIETGLDLTFLQLSCRLMTNHGAWHMSIFGRDPQPPLRRVLIDESSNYISLYTGSTRVFSVFYNVNSLSISIENDDISPPVFKILFSDQ
jgi:hypothetical protein